jgi:hypothetical protein
MIIASSYTSSIKTQIQDGKRTNYLAYTVGQYLFYTTYRILWMVRPGFTVLESEFALVHGIVSGLLCRHWCLGICGSTDWRKDTGNDRPWALLLFVCWDWQRYWGSAAFVAVPDLMIPYSSSKVYGRIRLLLVETRSRYRHK